MQNGLVQEKEQLMSMFQMEIRFRKCELLILGSFVLPKSLNDGILKRKYIHKVDRNACTNNAVVLPKYLVTNCMGIYTFSSLECSSNEAARLYKHLVTNCVGIDLTYNQCLQEKLQAKGDPWGSSIQ
jgi:hypothetical protein